MRETTQAKKPTAAKILRLCGFFACQLFNLVSLVLFAIQADLAKALMCLASMTFVCIPEIVQRLFRFRIQTPLYFVVLLYTICPLLGFCYDFYYKLNWWDDVLHAFAGIVFAMFGAYLPRVLNKKGTCSVALCALFGFVFSIAVSGVWEFIEFGIDTLFGMDMQKDTWLETIRNSHLLSKLLGYEDGVLAGTDQYGGILIGGNVNARYLDIGLIDTMTDMLVESAGALLYTIVYIVGKGKHFVFEPLKTELSERLPDQTSNAVDARNAATETAKAAEATVTVETAETAETDSNCA